MPLRVECMTAFIPSLGGGGSGSITFCCILLTSSNNKQKSRQFCKSKLEDFVMPGKVDVTTLARALLFANFVYCSLKFCSFRGTVSCRYSDR